MKASEILIYLSMKYQGNWDQIYQALTSEEKEKIDEKEAKKLISKVKSSVVTILDENYPETLKSIQKPPFVLYYHGDISLIKDKYKCVSIVGSRKNSKYGEEVTTYFSKELSKDVIIVSGLARGIDGIAHRACIENGGRTIAVLGCGINVCYPPCNLDIYSEIKKHHLLISEYPDLTPPNPLAFPIRNRIVAGLSNCLLVTEGLKNSGTSITASITLNNGGNVCCVPTKIGENSICNHLISYGAFLVETPEDVLYAMGFKKNEPLFQKSEN